MNVEMILGKNKQWVPLVDGKLLHSSVDPVREAKQFVDSLWSRIQNSQSLIVFGLGGGYHISELLSRKEFNIVVVELCHDVIQHMEVRNKNLMSKIEVVSTIGESIGEIDSLLEAMASSFSLVTHRPSFSLFPERYETILEQINSRTAGKLVELTKQNQRLNRFFKSLNLEDHQIVTLPDVEGALNKRGEGLDKEGLVWMTMRELVV